jgi:hypothetical protein
VKSITKRSRRGVTRRKTKRKTKQENEEECKRKEWEKKIGYLYFLLRKIHQQKYLGACKCDMKVHFDF